MTMNGKSQWPNGPISKQDTKQDHEAVSSADGRSFRIRLDDISGDEIDEVSSIKVPEPRRRYTNPLANDPPEEHGATEKRIIDTDLRNPLSSNEGPISAVPSTTDEGLQPVLHSLRQSDDCQETLTDEDKRINENFKNNTSLPSTIEEIGTVSKSLTKPEYCVKGSISDNETKRGRQWSTIKEERMKILSNATRATVTANLTTVTSVQKCTPPAPLRRTFPAKPSTVTSVQKCTSYASNGQIASTCKEHVTQSTTSIETVINSLGLSLHPILTSQQKSKSNSEYGTARPVYYLRYRKPNSIDSVRRSFSVTKRHVTKATGASQYEYSSIKLLTLSDHASPVRNTRSSTFGDRFICHLPDVDEVEKRLPNILGRKMNNQFPAEHFTRNPADDLSTSRAKSMKVYSAPPLPRGKKYHVFFSYGHVKSDESWVKSVITILESPPLSYKCCFDKRDFIPGQPILDSTVRAISESARVVIVLTNEYIKCERCQRESDMMQICKASIIPLLLDSCHIPIKLKVFSSITVSHDNGDWWVPFLKALKGKIPHLQSPKQDHLFLFHGDSVKDTKRIELLMTALESSEHEFRCTSNGKNFLSGQSIDGSLFMHANKAALTIVAFSKYIHKNTWLKYWQKLRDQDVHTIPLMFDRIEIQRQLKGIVIFDATKQQDIWLPNLIEQVMKYMD